MILSKIKIKGVLVKSFILVLIFTGLAGFILDFIVRVLSNEKIVFDRKSGLLLLLNIPVYAVGGALIYLLYMIPLFHSTIWGIVFYLIGGLACCLVEFGFGYLLNIKLKLNIWNYQTKFNIMGQTDLYHFIGFTLLTIPVVNLTWLIGLLGK